VRKKLYGERTGINNVKKGKKIRETKKQEMDDGINTSKAWGGVVKKGSISTNIYNQNLSDRYIVTRLMRMLLMMIGIAGTTWYNHLTAAGIDNRDTVTSC
jgi:hypothetical protein